MKKSCFIIGGGHSLVNLDWECLKDVDTITTNMSLFSVPNPNYFVTVDYTFYGKLKKDLQEGFHLIPATKFFVVNMSPGTPLVYKEGRIEDPRYNLIYDLEQYDVIVKAKQNNGFGYSFGDFRTGINSGYCALQTAIALGYNQIFILGIDLNVNNLTHYHDYYEKSSDFQNRLNKYLTYFTEGIRQLNAEGKIELYNCSETSELMKLIPTVPVSLALEMAK